MVKALITGFDSAWTRHNRGAIAHGLVSGNDVSFIPPVLASFDEALVSIRQHEVGTELQMFGIDQPLIVPNETGSRPVEGALRPLLSRNKAAIQPSSRSREDMFGDGAPIWQFLRELDADDEFENAIRAKVGRYAVEIYPCAALLGMYPEFRARKRAAKYNPGNRKMFSRYDWQRVCELVGASADDLGITGLSTWTATAAAEPTLRKHHQDMLDAAICVLVAFMWWQTGYERCIAVGDLERGYIVTPSDSETTSQIRAAASDRGVSVQPPVIEKIQA